MQLLRLLIDGYTLVIFVSIIGSWVNSGSEFFRFADRLTDPVLRPIRAVLPSVGGFDLSPMLLLMGLRMLSGLVR